MAESPSSAPRGPKGKEKKTRGFGRVISKVMIALKRGESSKSQLRQPSATLLQPTTSAAEASKPPSSKPVPLSKAAEARARYEGLEGVTKVIRSQLLQERAKKLAERYGLEISSSDLIRTSADDTVLRMDKPIRIRLRITCHRCDTALTTSKECPNCQHLRCTKCTRYPPLRTEVEKLASRERRAAMVQAQKDNPPIMPDYSYADTGIVLKRPSKTGGQDLYHKKPRQRVRRTCHLCQAVFLTGSKKCQDCAHVRCTDCPRDPPKKNKYPFGYPGDAFAPDSVPRYECDRCETLLPLAVDMGFACRKCGHHVSDDSPRALPRKVEPEPDPEILTMIRAKLDSLKIA
ncbi:hypothetical protein XA68_14211 [Ophiocordyceps unilateralis]|uniref:Uncharacterized protein n=1 Tax=Ophiocordyceps unilateralis TaxID=268505 RepID=A0A2A9P9T4_OPHUN|nr:hypothetical protein XA68_14211 [Ophiocordyceps unilateralis]